MMKLSAKSMRIFRRAQRKYNVSMEFLKANMANIRQFVLYAVSPHIIIKIQALRKRCSGGRGGQRIVLDYHHLRRFLFDPARRKMLKKRKRNVQQWSKRMVLHLKSRIGQQEYVEDDEEVQKTQPTEIPAPIMASEDVSKQLKQQLELLRSGNRIAKFSDGSGNVGEATKNNANVTTQLQQSIDTPSGTSLPKVAVDTDTKKIRIDEATIVEDAEEAPIVVESEAEAPIFKVAHANATHLRKNTADERHSEQEICEKTPEKQIVAAPTNGYIENLLQQQKTTSNKDIDEKTEEGDRDHNSDHPIDTDDNGGNSAALQTSKRSSSFLDMLMSKVRVRQISVDEEKNKSCTKPETSPIKDQQQGSGQTEAAELTDSSEEFLGFEETERTPGMLLTPLVPFSKKNTASSAFVSELLNNYLRDNLLESSESKNEAHDGCRRIHRQANFDGLVTPTAIPPSMSMPAVPESLQRLRTVAERRQFLQKFSKNHKLSIINNEATIYRELQRKIRQQKVKSAPLQMLQAPSANMPFTRQGWQAASFVVTDYNKYFYQMLQADGSAELIKLPGVSGNNEEKLKKPHISRLPKSLKAIMRNCPDGCYDLLAWRDFKAIKTQANKAKLNKNPFRPVFPPCPLSQKPFQKPLDDETAALLLAGGSMAVVRMPTVELEVFPEVARPLHEVAKRYLQYILPHHDISREWAEFSVSTLQHQLPRTVKEAEQAAAAANAAEGNGRRKSFTFAIPYLNDRNHILVRRVVDRSEQLDRSFEESRDSSNTVADLSFRAGIDPNDTLLQECADVVSDMITSVAISCSENSFLKDDPHGVNSEHAKILDKTAKTQKDKELGALADKANDSRGGGIVSMPQQNRKQHRLLLELRRLNATIIDAGAKQEKETKPCYKEHCALGCICSSLTDEYPMRQHCGKSKCVLECHCKIPNNSHIMRLETDGRSITTEDAFLLRRKATARLARMEKEFTSTIVLTGNETLLINESQYDKKRRCTKAPKRYDDFTDADDDFQAAGNNAAQQTNNGAMVSFETTCSAFGEEPASATHANSSYTELTTELREPIYIKDSILNELKHCSVTLVPLQDVKNVAVWCMVHELYKCYCGGRAIDGKPLVIEKEEVNVTIDASKTGEDDYVAATPKARYSFEKLEHEVAPTAATKSKIINLNEDSSESVRIIMDNDNVSEAPDTGHEEQTTSNDDEDGDDNDEEDDIDRFGANYKPHSSLKTIMHKRGRPQKIERRGRPMEATIIRDYMNAKLSWCRRVVAVPMKTYLRRNRRRLEEVQEYIRNNETTKSQLILNEHILRSVYYHKHELEKTQQAAVKEKQQQVKLEKMPVPVPAPSSEMPQPAPAPLPATQTPDVEIIDNDVQIIDENSTQSSAASTKSQRRRERRKRLRTEMLAANSNAIPKVPPLDNSKKPRIAADVASTGNNSTASNVLPVTQSSAQNNNNCIQIPKISNYYSLNQQAMNPAAQTSSSVACGAPTEVQAYQLPASADICAATQGSEGQTAADLGLIEGAVSTDNFKEFYNVVIKNMNNLVSKKMQDIDMALKRESKVIPPPNEEILCIIKWSNFLDAFIEGYVYIWEVQLDDPQQRPFFAATITNLMPMIFGAVGVVNIAALQGKQLPLVGRMLLERCRSERTRKLAIVMQGRSKYWLVKGFLHPDSTKACAKPTPHTHPLLTRKINVLCSLLVKQRVKEHQRKLELQQQQQDKIAATAAQNQNVQDVEFLPNRPVVARRIVPKSLPATHAPVTTVNDTTRSVIASQKQTLPTQKMIPPTLASRSHAQQKQQSASSNLLRNLAAREEFLNMKSNIEFRKVTLHDIKEIQLPQMHQDDHRWLVLDLCNDFSHIFVPDFRDLVSLDRIHKVMAFSRQRRKNVKLQFFQNAPYDAFVTPSSKRNIYFGPLKFNMRPPLLILLQSVDGQMMLREVFQQQHQIQTAGRQRTTAFWILQINGQIHYQIEGDPNTDHLQQQLQLQQEFNLEKAKQAELQRQLEPENHVEDSDEDCVIVEDNDSQQRSNDAHEDIGELVSAQTLAQPDKYCSIVTNPKSNGIPLLPQALPQAISLDSPPIESHATTSPMRMNFTIQAVDSSSQLQITTDATNAMPHMQVQESMMTTRGTLIPLPVTLPNNTTNQQLPGFMPLSVVITNVAPAPQEAPYSSTIYLSNMSGAGDNDATSTVPATCAESAAIQTTATTSNTTGFQTFQVPNTTSQMTTQTTPCTSTTFAEKPISTTPAPIKRRRMSLRCPPIADMETRNIAIDAAMKLLPDPSNKLVTPEVCVEELEMPHPNKLPNNNKKAVPATSAESAAIQTTATTSNTTGVQTFQILNTTSQMITQTTPSTSTTSAEKPISTTPAPIKRRRMSLRYPLIADMETRNMAIDAAMKLLPDPSNKLVIPEVCVEELEMPHPNKLPKLTKQPSITAVEPVNVSTTPTIATPTTVLVHNTTITKLKDTTPALNTKTKPWQKKPADNVPKYRFIAPKTASEVAINAAEHSLIATPAPPLPPSLPPSLPPTPTKLKPVKPAIPPPPPQTAASNAPIVFDVNFIDNADEPAASIVIKPTLVTTPKPLPPFTTNSLTVLNKPTVSTTVATSMANAVSTNAEVNSSLPTQIQDNSVLKAQLNTTMTATTAAVPKLKTNIIAGNTRVQPKTAAPTVRMVAKPGVVVNQQTVVKNLPTYSVKKHVTITQNTASSSQSKNTIITTSQSNSVVRIPNLKTVAAPTSNNVQASNTRLSTPMMSSSATMTTMRNQSPKKIATLPTGLGQTQRRSLPIQLPKHTQNVTLNNTPAITTNATPVNSQTVANTQQDIQYGYFSSNVAGFPKFVVKRVENDYLIRVPNCQGILKVNGMANVNQYLNRHMLKCNPGDCYGKLPALWKFVPQDRLNPVNRKIKDRLNQAGKVNTSSNRTTLYVDAIRTISAPIPVKTVVMAQTPKVISSPAINTTSTTHDKCDTILIED